MVCSRHNYYYISPGLPPFRHGVYYVWTRWGRVGEPGQNALKMFKLLPEAEKEFKKKFSDKTKNKWETRDKFVPAPGKYTLIEMDEEDEEMDQVIYRGGKRNVLAITDYRDGI